MIVPKHTSFPQPANGGEKVWRYLSLSKLLDSLFFDTLYFTRVDLLDDKHEGTYTKINTNRLFSGNISIGSGLTLSQEEYTKRVRECLHVNCWRLDNHESEAMWKVYCPNNGGVAIQTTYNKLVQSLPENNKLYIGLITYLDYEVASIDSGNNFNPVMHKRISFEHEKEVRIVKSNFEYMNDHKLPMPTAGIKIKTNLLENTENIYVNPYADTWYFETTKELFSKLNINVPLKWSEIKSDIHY
jgi:hypothetical protein